MTTKDLLPLCEKVLWPAILNLDAIEKDLGVPLPRDFVEIISCFGLGVFGALCLFHPLDKDAGSRLPYAVYHAHDLLSTHLDFPKKPSPDCIVLGILEAREYLVFSAAAGWRIFDSELEIFTNIGPDLCAFLYRAYHQQGELERGIGMQMWGRPFPQSPFF